MFSNMIGLTKHTKGAKLSYRGSPLEGKSANACKALQKYFINREDIYMKKVIALLLSLTIVVGMLTACGAKEEAPEAPAATEEAEAPAEEAAPAADGSVYYLNFKPEHHTSS